MGLLTREQILAADDLATELVDVPEWGGQVAIRAMSVAERIRFESAFDRDRTKAIPALLTFALADADGNPMFTEADIEALSGKSMPVLLRLFQIAQKKNALTPEDVRELEKKSQPSPHANSHSA
jgi:hypothetical protein